MALSPRYHPWLVLWLLAFWLAAGQHCRLEASLGLASDTCHPAAGQADDCDDPCALDTCHSSEGAALSRSTLLAEMPLPPLGLTADFLADLLLLEPLRAETFLASLAPPREDGWPTRHFARRASPLARAPDAHR